MKKIWAYIAMIFIGIASGMAIMYKLVAKNINSTTIKGKIKQKRTHGSVQDVTNTITKTETRKNRKEERKQKRALRKEQK